MDVEDLCTEEQSFKRQKAKEELNNVIHLLAVDTIRDG